MKFSIITPNRNGEKFLQEAIQSILIQKKDGIDLEYILVDGNSTDASLKIIDRYRSEISVLIIEPDNGPADAINKGLKSATGDIIAWLNADDRYHPGAFQRIASAFNSHPEKALCFGRCRIIDEQNKEIRKPITRFKESFFPISSRFTIQCLNYISQPALFIRRSTQQSVGLLRTDVTAAWDYDFILRLWRYGGGFCLKDEQPIADFRWHENSISGKRFTAQFKEEAQIAQRDAGYFSPQSLIHQMVRWGIVGTYSLMAAFRK